jgi:GT2 family glycosyltransferase
MKNRQFQKMTTLLRKIKKTPRIIDFRYSISNLLNRFQFTLKKKTILIRLDKAELYADNLYVTGWALSRKGFKGIERIEVYVDSHLIGNATYGEMRLDVEQAYPSVKNSGKSGFHLSADLSTFLQSGVKGHHVLVKAIGVDQQSRTTSKACAKSRYQSLTLPTPETYQQWYELNKCSPAALTAQGEEVRRWETHPLISVIIPVFNSPSQWLDELLSSIHHQSYPVWECILVDDASPKTDHVEVIRHWCQKDSRFRFVQHKENQGVSNTSQTGVQEAKGSYVCVVDHDDIVEPQALFEVARVIRDKHPDVIYSDELLMQEDGTMIRCEFRPDFNYHFLLSHPYIVHLTAFRREVVLKVGGFTKNLQVSQDYDLLLRIAAITQFFYHLPKVLYRWRIHAHSTGHKLEVKVNPQSLAALNHHLRLVGFREEEAWAEQGLSFNFYRIRYHIQPAKISVIIPIKDKSYLLRNCLDSFQNLTHLPKEIQVEFIIVDNGSTCPKTLKYLEQLKSAGHQILRIPGPFNFSSLNNKAVEQATGSLLLFMNNDIEIVEADWLEAMLELMSLSNVAVVGAKLVYPDANLIQHAGVIIGFNRTAAHDHQFYPEFDHNHHPTPGHSSAMLVIRESMGVTAACMLVRRSVFETVGGFDENLRVGYSDADLCLKIRAQGYKILITPYARLIHHESATRGYQYTDLHPDDTALFAKRWAHLIKAGDPFYNRNLALQGRLFEPNMH